jgi:uncharacterized protein YoaH (UPF0181 family)
VVVLKESELDGFLPGLSHEIESKANEEIEELSTEASSDSHESIV